MSVQLPNGQPNLSWSNINPQAYTSATANTTNQQQDQNSTQQNLYGQGQQQLQGQIPGLLSSLVGGGMGSFTNPQALLAQYNQQFQNTVAPNLAAQYGAGSPQIASQQNQGLVNLLGNQYNTGVSNYTNALNSAGQYGLSSVGSNTNTTNANASQSQGLAGSTLLGLLLQMSQQALSPFGSPSDKRLKENIKPLEKKTALEQIKKLVSVAFNWRKETNMGNKLQLGFIAQEVEQVIPEAVGKAPNNDIYYLDKETIIPVLVAAVQELTERLEKLEKE
jgi:hypothetical protein